MRHTYFLSLYCAMFLLGAGNVAAQDNTSSGAAIKAFADKACECTMQISASQGKDALIIQINSCITAVMKENESFDAIQQYLNENCERVRTLMSTDAVKRDYSMSENVNALQYYNAGKEFTRHEQFDKAIESYKKALKADDKFAFAWDNMGLCYRKLGKYKEAISCYEKSYKLQPMGTTSVMNMGVAYTFLEDYKSAAKAYAILVTNHPQDPEGYYGAGKAYFLDGDYYKGVDNMLKAYKMYKEVKSPYVSDAAKMIESFYAELKQKGKEDVFRQAAKSNNIDIKM